MIEIILAVQRWIEKYPVTASVIIIPLGLWIMGLIKHIFERYILKNSARKVGLPAFPRGNIFHFGAQHTRLYGRDDEIKRLKAFCKRKVIAKSQTYQYLPENHPVLWWMVSGEGGSGKSKLCYHFLRKMKHRGWTVCMPTKPTEGHRKESLADASRSLPNKTLFLLDYAEYDTHVINEWINTLAEKKRRNSRRIRIILVQRREKEGYGSFPKNFCYADPLELKAKLNEDALNKIIKNFANKELKKKLKIGQPQEILKKLKMVDSNLLRPLFAIILASAQVDGVPITSKDQALNYIYNHEKERYAGVLRDMGYKCNFKDDSEDNLVMYTVMTIITFATVAGSLKLDDAGIELLPLVYRDCAKKLSRRLMPREGYPSSTKKEIELFEWIPKKSIVECKPLEPDIIGEFFVLTWLKEIGNEIAMAIISNAWTSAYFTMRFVNKLFQDYKDEKWIFDNKTQSQFTVVKLPACMSRVRTFEFAKFAQMTRLIIPGTIKIIEESAFFGCKSLVKVTIGNGVETIERGAFAQCNSLRIFSMADTVTHIGEGVFSGCKVLSNIKYSRLLAKSEIGTVHQAQIYSKRFGGYDWMVLDYKEDGQSQVLLVSKCVLKTIEFDANINDSVWKTARGGTSYINSTIRKYLLEKFVSLLGLTNDTVGELHPLTLEESTNTRWGTTWANSVSNNMADSIWLLSCEEVEKYFPDQKQVAKTDGHPSNWWLRTCGINDHFACIVNEDGFLDFDGIQNNHKAGLRPAFWLNISR